METIGTNCRSNVCETREIVLKEKKKLVITSACNGKRKERHGSQAVQEEISLIKVTKDELRKLRKCGEAIFVLKEGDCLFCAQVPKRFSYRMQGIRETNICCKGNGQMCGRFSSMSDEDGGCAKVRNGSTCIEDFPWITKGVEIYGSKGDIFAVIDCANFRLATGDERRVPKREEEEDYRSMMEEANPRRIKWRIV